MPNIHEVLGSVSRATKAKEEGEREKGGGQNQVFQETDGDDMQRVRKLNRDV